MRSIEEIQADATSAADSSDIESLLRYAEELEGLHTTAADASANGIRGAACQLRGNHSEALGYYQRSLDQYESIENRSGVAGMLRNLGNTHAGMGEFNAALEYFLRALSLNEELSNRLHAANDTGNIGNVYSGIGDYPAALGYYHRAMAMHEELGNRIGMGTVAGSLGILYRRTGDAVKALEYYNLALGVYEELGNRYRIAMTVGNIGNVHYGRGDHAEALTYYRKACALYEELGNPRGAVLIYPNLLASLIALGSRTEAVALLADIDNEPIDDPEWRITREFGRAILQEQDGDIDASAVTLNSVLEEARVHGLRSHIVTAHQLLRDLALKQNHLAEYVAHNNEFMRINEEINGKETATKLAMQEAERTMAKERQEHEKQLAVLHSTLPKHIADRVSRGEQVTDHYSSAAVIFVDIVGFTTLSSQLSSTQVVDLLSSIFKTFDAICKQHGVVKIKTIGDSYMAVSFPENAEPETENSDSSSDTTAAERAARAALDMLHAVSHVVSPAGSTVQVRVGVHTGPLTAGVLGTERLQYDVWGDTVNVASRMESTGEPGRVQVSQAFERSFASAQDDGRGRHPEERSNEGPLFTLTERGTIDIKGKGAMKTFWLEGA